MTPSNVDENTLLYQRIRSGDKAAITEMIERNTPLVKSRVGAFLKDYSRFKHLFDDLIGEGNLAPTHVVNSFATAHIEKPTGRIVSEIDYALGNYVDSEIGAGMICGRTVQRRRERTESIPNQLPFDVAAPPVRLWRNSSGRVIRKQIEDENGSPCDTPELERGEFGMKSVVGHVDAEQIIARYEQADSTAENDTLHEILSCCKTEQEKSIVRLRMQGFNDAEIGEHLGVSRATIGRRRKAVEMRFNERIKKARQ